MAGRNLAFLTGEFYHVFNRGVARQPVFLDKKDYSQAMLGLTYYRYANPPLKLSRYKGLPKEQRDRLSQNLSASKQLLVEIQSFVLMPNHFHLLLKQVKDGGVALFLSRFTNSYTKYFNTKQERVGPLFQGVFKAVWVESEEQLMHLSRYIHLNPYASSVVKREELLNYLWSSLPGLVKSNTEFESEEILKFFPSGEDYKTFVFNHADYARKLEEIKHLTLDIV